MPAGQDGWVEFVLNQKPKDDTAIGLSYFNADLNNTIDFAFYFTGKEVLIYSGGISLGTLGNPIEGDVYRISREGTDIKYYRNNAVVFVRVATLNPLFVDISMATGSLPGVNYTPEVISASFESTRRNYYSIASGNWTSPTVWSLTNGGISAGSCPSNSDIVTIAGHSINVGTSSIFCAGVNIVATASSTSLRVDGKNSILTVGGEVSISGAGNANTAKALVVQNEGKIVCQP